VCGPVLPGVHAHRASWPTIAAAGGEGFPAACMPPQRMSPRCPPPCTPHPVNGPAWPAAALQRAACLHVAAAAAPQPAACWHGVGLWRAPCARAAGGAAAPQSAVCLHGVGSARVRVGL